MPADVGAEDERVRIGRANRGVRDHGERAIDPRVGALEVAVQVRLVPDAPQIDVVAVAGDGRVDEVVPVLVVQGRILVRVTAVRPRRRVGERGEDCAMRPPRLVAPRVGRLPVVAALAGRLDDVPAVRETDDAGAELGHLVRHLRRQHARVHPEVIVLGERGAARAGGQTDEQKHDGAHRVP